MSTIDLTTPRAHYVHSFEPIGGSSELRTPQQRERAAAEGVTHVYRFEPSAPAWLSTAANAAGYRVVQLGYTNHRRHGGSVSELYGLVPMVAAPEPRP